MVDTLHILSLQCHLYYLQYYSGYGIVDAEYRAKRVLSDMLGIRALTGINQGYHGTLSRTSILSTGGYISTKRGGGQFIGVIPDSINSGEDAWVDDLVIHGPYADDELVVMHL